MANEHGRLPKADPERLDPELRRRFEVWRAKAYRDDNLFLTLARRPAVLDLFLAWVVVHLRGRREPRSRRWWSSAASASPSATSACTEASRAAHRWCARGSTEPEVQQALGDLDRAELPARTVAALRLADCLSGERPRVDDALFGHAAASTSTRGEILELGAALTVASGWQRLDRGVRHPPRRLERDAPRCPGSAERSPGRPLYSPMSSAHRAGLACDESGPSAPGTARRRAPPPSRRGARRRSSSPRNVRFSPTITRGIP